MSRAKNISKRRNLNEFITRLNKTDQSDVKSDYRSSSMTAVVWQHKCDCRVEIHHSNLVYPG